jgi:hypothetical protein
MMDHNVNGQPNFDIRKFQLMERQLVPGVVDPVPFVAPFFLIFPYKVIESIADETVKETGCKNTSKGWKPYAVESYDR